MAGWGTFLTTNVASTPTSVGSTPGVAASTPPITTAAAAPVKLDGTAPANVPTTYPPAVIAATDHVPLAAGPITSEVDEPFFELLTADITEKDDFTHLNNTDEVAIQREYNGLRKAYPGYDHSELIRQLVIKGYNLERSQFIVRQDTITHHFCSLVNAGYTLDELHQALTALQERTDKFHALTEQLRVARSAVRDLEQDMALLTVFPGPKQSSVTSPEPKTPLAKNISAAK